MQVGWVWLDVYDCWGYFDPNGAGHDGWISAGSDWYYTIAGRCCTNMVITLRHSGTDETVRYLLDSEGVMRRNTWSLRSGGYWYYFGEDGAAYTNGTYRIGGEDFYFDEEGKCYR
jgi:glucan-binding YG repeat protein